MTIDNDNNIRFTERTYHKGMKPTEAKYEFKIL